jgi:hypothetical protein
VDAPALSFPTTAVNQASSAQTVSVENDGNQPLIFTGLAASANFNVDSNTTTCSTSSPPALGTTCTVGVVFAPTPGGNLSGALTITDNSLNANPASQQVQLSSTVSQLPSLSQNSLTFGIEGVGLTSSKLTVQLINNSSAAVAVSGISSTADFVVTTTCGSSLANTQACAISASFNPQSSGGFSETVNIVAGSTSLPLQLTGTGGTSALTLNPATEAFGSVGTGGSVAKTFTLTNNSTSPVTISAPGTGVGTNLAAFQVTADSCSGQMIAVNKSCGFTVSFAPSSAGSLNGLLTINSTAAVNPTVTLSGTGVTAALTLNATTENFGSTGIGTSKTAAFTLYNYTNAPATITSISTPLPAFAVGPDTCSGQTLAVDRGCNFTVSYTPTSTGATGAVTLTVNSAAGTPTVTLSGTGH